MQYCNGIYPIIYRYNRQRNMTSHIPDFLDCFQGLEYFPALIISLAFWAIQINNIWALQH